MNHLQRLPRVSVLMTTPSSTARPSGNQRYLSIEIRDEDSGVVIADVAIEPEQVINLLGNATVYATADVVQPHNAEKLGKFLVVDQRSVTGEGGARLGYGAQHDHPRVQAAIRDAKEEGWEQVIYRHSHGSHSLTLRKWVAERPADGGRAYRD